MFLTDDGNKQKHVYNGDGKVLMLAKGDFPLTQLQ